MDKVRIGSIYGCFPSCIANGGRTQGGQRWSQQQIEALYTTIDEMDLATRLTLTNLLLEKHHLEDEYFQQILASSQGHAVEAIIATRVLDSCIKDAYPDMPRILSTTRKILSIEKFNRETPHFDCVALNTGKDKIFIKVNYYQRYRVKRQKTLNYFRFPGTTMPSHPYYLKGR